MNLTSTTNGTVDGVVETPVPLAMVNGANHVQSSGDTPPGGIHVPLRDVHAWTPERKLDIITVGAGFSGLMLAHKLQHEHPELQAMVNHKIFESRETVGGTWLVNTYPGVQCDVPAHIYVSLEPCKSLTRCSYPYQTFPFDPKPDWDNFYATGPDIQDYITATTKKWDLDRDVRFKHRVVDAVWQQDSAKWKVTIENANQVIVEHADILVSGQGVLTYVVIDLQR